MKILLIEDDINVTNFIKKGLIENNYEIECANNGESGLLIFTQNTFDLIILDVIMPKMNGYQVCKSLRNQNAKIPILILSALGSSLDKVTGLDLGADDYLIKPFDFSELLARIRALLRRNNNSWDNKQILVTGDLELNNNTKCVFRKGTEIKLTPKEFNLLLYFMQNKGRVLSRYDLASNVWDNGLDSGTNVVDVYVNYLRNKIDKNFKNKYVHTVVGMGYIFKEE
jgi:two-component system copper resistance phosphate regulon response regulator CusR